MKQHPFRSTSSRRVLATVVFVALAASSSPAQSSVSSPVPVESAAPAPASQCPSRSAAAVPLPASIQVSDDLRPRLQAMLVKSATFRSQCRRIGESRQLYVRVKVDMSMTGRQYRALTRICRQRSGNVIASIGIAPFGDPAEWLAHEFEHLIEQLDGINLRDLERRGQGAWRSGNQMFETERAVRVGRRVLREMRESAGGQLAESAVIEPSLR